MDSLENTQIPTHFQTELPIKVESISTDSQETLKRHSEQLDKIQSELEDLSSVNSEIFNMVYEQQKSNPIEEIKSIKQHIAVIEKGIIKVYQHIEKDNTGKEIKSEQELLRKAIETNQKKTTEDSTVYLDWRQLSIIITATALAASLCSYAVFQAVASWKADQPENPPEKVLKTKSKKSSK